MSDELAKAKVTLDTCRASYDKAAFALDAARRDETEARNRLNQAQKNFDTVVAAIRGDAPRDTDWKREPGIPGG